MGTVVVLSGLGEGIQSTVELLHGDKSLTLAHVGTDELGVTADSLVAVLDGLGESHQLDQSRSTVGVTTGVLRSTLGHLGESINSGGPVTLLELLLTELTGLLGLGGIHVGVLLGGGLELLSVAQLGQGLGGTELGERLVVELNGLGEVTQLLVGTADTGESPMKSQ